MKRSPMPPRTKPMRSKAPAKRAAMKSSRPKMTPIRKSAKDGTLRSPGVCNGDPGTTVLCHSNRLSDGKGTGLKAPDTAACFGCSACHDVLDGRRPRPAWLSLEMLLVAFDAAVVRTHEKLKRKGLM